MNKLYYLLFSSSILFLSHLPALAQRPKPAAVTMPPTDTVYFDRDWTRTETLEEVAYARIAHRTVDGKTVGTVRDYFYPSWKKQGEGKLLSENPDVLTGICAGWHESGQLSFRGTYVLGQAQADFKSWNEAGREIKCRYLTQDALPLISATLSCLNCMNSSRKVFTVELPVNTSGVVYKLDLRDTGQPPVTWSTTLSLAGTLATGGMAAPALLTATASALASRGNVTIATKPTKCHWYITASSDAAQQFLDTKGFISNLRALYRRETNVPQTTSPLALEAGTRRLYICVNNDNQATDATATLSVTALVQACQ